MHTSKCIFFQQVDPNNWKRKYIPWSARHVATTVHHYPQIAWCDVWLVRFWGDSWCCFDSHFLAVLPISAQVQFTWAAEDFIKIPICVSESLCHIIRIWVQSQDAKASTTLSSGLKLIRFPDCCMTVVSFLWVRWKKKPSPIDYWINQI